MAGAFFKTPVGRWTIDFDKADDRITVKCEGEAVAWGSFYYESDMADTFRRYQLTSGRPLCKECGHEMHEHLKPSGLELETPTIHRSGCNWGGGHEGWCDCRGYVT